MMRTNRKFLFNLGMIVIPWLSLFFMDKREIKRFFPAAIVIIILEIITEKIGQKRKWWVFDSKPTSFFLNEFFFSMGPFLIGAVWILKLSHGNFKNFVLLNVVVNAFFAYVITKFLNMIKIARLERLNEFKFFIYLFSKVPLLYFAQLLFEKRKVIEM